jgi:hypothetical protein
MAGTGSAAKLTIVTEAKNAEKTVKKLNKVKKGILGTGKAAKKSSKQVVAGNKENTTSTKAFTSAMLGMGLSFLFTGMAIKRFAQGLLKNVFNAYAQVMGEGSRFAEQTNALKAAFGFLKFSIVDALANSELFASMIAGVVSLVNWISQFVAKHPLIAQIFLIFLALLLVFGALAMVFGQTVLGILGWIALLKLGSLGSFAFIAAGWAKLMAFMSAATPIFAISAVFAMAWLITKWADKVGGFGNFFKLVLAGLIMIGAGFVDTLVMMFLTGIDMIIVGLNAVIAAWNMIAKLVGGPQVSEIGYTSDAYHATGGVQQMAQDFIYSSDFFAGPLAALTAAQDAEGGGMGMLNPFSEGGVEAPDIPDFSAGVDNIETVNNTQNNISLEMEVIGISPEMQQDIINATIEGAVEQGLLEGGAPQENG